MIWFICNKIPGPLSLFLCFWKLKQWYCICFHACNVVNISLCVYAGNSTCDALALELQLDRAKFSSFIIIKLIGECRKTKKESRFFFFFCMLGFWNIWNYRCQQNLQTTGLSSELFDFYPNRFNMENGWKLKLKWHLILGSLTYFFFWIQHDLCP